jgi:hypothetical protein
MIISVMFRHVLKMRKMNDFSDNDLHGTSLSIVLWIPINLIKSMVCYYGIHDDVCKLLKLWRA